MQLCQCFVHVRAGRRQNAVTNAPSPQVAFVVSMLARFGWCGSMHFGRLRHLAATPGFCQTISSFHYMGGVFPAALQNERVREPQ